MLHPQCRCGVCLFEYGYSRTSYRINERLHTFLFNNLPRSRADAPLLLYMKRLTFIFSCFLASLLFSCATNEDRALDLVDAYMQACLYDYDSYQPQGISIDTLHYTNQAAIIFSKVKPLIEIMEQQKTAKMNIKLARRRMAIFDISQSYRPSSLDRLDYEEASEEYNEAIAKLNQCESSIEAIKEEIQVLAEEIESGAIEDQLGWAIVHMYTCKTRGGDDTGGAVFIITDSNFKEVLFAMDEDELMEIDSSLEVLGLNFPTF